MAERPPLPEAEGGRGPRADHGKESVGSAWERVKLARHPARPYTLDYIKLLCADFLELHGDRTFADDGALVGGLAILDGRTLVVLGHQKGRDARENALRRFGMARPEGYRKARRLMRHAEKFGFPLLTFIDTPGADPSLQSEERGQAWALAENLLELARLRVPVVAVVIGEGGSGGAIAIGLADRVLMLENAIYSVASPEGCAAILWKDSSKAPEAAEAMRITAADALAAGVVDQIVPEPEGGAHTDPARAAALLGEALRTTLDDLERRYGRGDSLCVEALLQARWARYRAIGAFHERQLAAVGS